MFGFLENAEQVNSHALVFFSRRQNERKINTASVSFEKGNSVIQVHLKSEEDECRPTSVKSSRAKYRGANWSVPTAFIKCSRSVCGEQVSGSRISLVAIFFEYWVLQLIHLWVSIPKGRVEPPFNPPSFNFPSRSD